MHARYNSPIDIAKVHIAALMEAFAYVPPFITYLIDSLVHGHIPPELIIILI